MIQETDISMLIATIDRQSRKIEELEAVNGNNRVALLIANGRLKRAKAQRDRLRAKAKAQKATEQG